jgi:hypothetical protein
MVISRILGQRQRDGVTAAGGSGTPTNMMCGPPGSGDGTVGATSTPSTGFIAIVPSSAMTDSCIGHCRQTTHATGRSAVLPSLRMRKYCAVAAGHSRARPGVFDADTAGGRFIRRSTAASGQQNDDEQ